MCMNAMINNAQRLLVKTNAKKGSRCGESHLDICTRINAMSLKVSSSLSDKKRTSKVIDKLRDIVLD